MMMRDARWRRMRFARRLRGAMIYLLGGAYARVSRYQAEAILRKDFGGRSCHVGHYRRFAVSAIHADE